MTSSNTYHEKRHPIQVAARRSGLTQDVLRAWEKRYAAVSPGRSAGGHRLYSDEDVERLRLLRLAVREGRRISDVAQLPESELAGLVAEDQVETSSAVPPPEVEPAVMRECLDAIHQLDAVRLEDILHRQLLSSGSLNLIEGLVAPLMVEVGRLWHEGRLSTSHEHLATEVLRSLVARILIDAQPHRPKGTIVIATTAGQRHEVGGLMAAATAAQLGWRVVFLGADLPAADIIDACAKVDADALGLSYSYRSDAANDLVEINAVADGLGEGVAVIIGGAAAVCARVEIEGLGIRVVSDLADFREALRALEPR